MTLRLFVQGGAIGVALAIMGLLCTTWPLIELAVAGVISLSNLVLAFALILPAMFSGVIPLATAMAITCAYENWISGNELVALRAAGMPDRKLMLPALVAAGAALIVTASISLYAMPIAFSAFEDIRYVGNFKPSFGLLGDGYSQPIAPEISLSFRRRLEADGLEDVTIRDGRFGDAFKFVFAKYAVFSQPDGHPALVLHHGSYRTLDKTGEISPPVEFEALIFPISDAGGYPKIREWRGFFEEPIWRLLAPEDAGIDPEMREAWLAEGHRRLLLPLLCPSFALFVLGTALAAGYRPGGLSIWRMLVPIVALCAWFALLIAVNAIAAQGPAGVLGYYVLGLLPGVAGLFLLRRGALPMEGGSMPVSEFGNGGIAAVGWVSTVAAHHPVRSGGLRGLVRSIDALMRRLLAITEFESERDSLIRIQLGRAERRIVLPDGSGVLPGDTAMELHLWNERVEPTPEGRFELGWAVRFRHQAVVSLHRLALRLHRDPKLSGVRAVYMRPSVELQKPTAALVRMLQKFGFEPVAEARRSPGYLFSLCENIWLWMLTWAHSPQSLRSRRFGRGRREFWISRSQFLALHGAGLAETGGDADAERELASAE